MTSLCARISAMCFYNRVIRKTVSGTIISLRLTAAQLYRADLQPNNDVTRLAKDLIERLVALESSGLASVGLQYTTNICNAVIGVADISRLRNHLEGPSTHSDEIHEEDLKRSMPAAAAAVGNIRILGTLTSTVEEMLRPSQNVFPNALSAAVASDQREVVTWILQALPRHGLSAARAEQHEIGAALQVAVRKHRTSIGDTLLDYLISEPELYPGDASMEQLVLSMATWSSFLGS